MKFKRIVPGAAAVLAALILTACAGAPGGGSSADGAALRIAVSFEPPSFDPATAQEGLFMAYYQAAYDTLLLREPDGKFAPMLATAWEYNDDKTALTLTLREDVVFSDGATFDAQAVRANIEHFQTAGGAQGATMDAVDSIEVVDTKTVRLHLRQPEPALLIYLSNAGGMMGSPEALGTDSIKTMPVGSGPYELDSARTVTGTDYVFTKKDDYWNPKLQHFDEVAFRVMSDDTSRYNALLSGQVDVSPLDSKTAKSAEEKGFIGHNQQVDWRGFIIFDRGGEMVPALGDVRVRQAINMAVDKEKVLATIEEGRGLPRNQIFAETSSGYLADLEDPYPYDPELAKQLLAEAGYSSGFAFEMPIVATVVDPAITAVIKDQLAAVGITVNYREVPSSEVIQEYTSGNYPIIYMQLFRPSTWVTIQQTLAPEALWNASHYADPKVTELIADIQYAEDAQAEEAKAQELNQYIIDQAWFAPWFAADWLLYANDSVDVELQVEQAMPSIYNYAPAK